MLTDHPLMRWMDTKQNHFFEVLPVIPEAVISKHNEKEESFDIDAIFLTLHPGSFDNSLMIYIPMKEYTSIAPSSMNVELFTVDDPSKKNQTMEERINGFDMKDAIAKVNIPFKNSFKKPSKDSLVNWISSVEKNDQKESLLYVSLLEKEPNEDLIVHFRILATSRKYRKRKLSIRVTLLNEENVALNTHSLWSFPLFTMTKKVVHRTQKVHAKETVFTKRLKPMVVDFQMVSSTFPVSVFDLSKDECNDLRDEAWHNIQCLHDGVEQLKEAFIKQFPAYDPSILGKRKKNTHVT